MGDTIQFMMDKAISLHADKEALLFDHNRSVLQRTFSDIDKIATSVSFKNEITAHGRHHELRGKVVGLLIEANIEIPAILIGLLRIGAIFYTIDEDIPAGKLRYLIKQLHMVDFLALDQTKKFLQKQLPEIKSSVLSVTGIPGLEHIRISMDDCSRVNFPDDLAYIITTSGTTGDPKIVKVPHSCIVPNITCIRSIYELTPGDRVYQASPLTFDPSIVEIFTTLSSGATLVMSHANIRARPQKLAELLHRQKITVIQMTPSLARSLGSAHLRPFLRRESPLRVLALGGEACPSPATLAEWKQEGWGGKIYNLYGITEVSSWATCADVTKYREGDDIPLGQPLANTVVTIRPIQGTDTEHCEKAKSAADETKCGHSESIVGQLYIGGEKRFCYIGDNDSLSTPVFRPSGDLVRRSTGGDIFYIGRLDEQIKRRGIRINLAQIEEVARKIKYLDAAAATYESETDKILLFVSMEISGTRSQRNESTAILVKRVQKHLTHILSDYMIPDEILILENLPITKHGKVDKTRLLSLVRVGVRSKRSVDVTRSIPALLQYIDDLWQKYTDAESQYIISGYANDATLDVDNLTSNPFTADTGDVTQEPSHSLSPDITSNFIESGGDSFRAVRFVEHIERDLIVNMPTLLDSLLNSSYQEVCHVILCHASEDGNSGKKRRFEEGLHKSSKAAKEECHGTISVPSIKITGAKTIVAAVSYERCGRVFLHSDTKSQNDVASSSIHTHEISSTPGPAEELQHDSFPRTNSEGIGGPSEIGDPHISLDIIWKFDTHKCVDASPLVTTTQSSGSSTVYIGSHSHIFCAIDLCSGSQIWQIALEDRIESSACLSACARYVIVGCYAGWVYVVDAATGDIEWKFETGGSVKSSPCVDHKSGFVYVGSHDKHVYCLDIQEKKVVWKHGTKGSCFSSPVIPTDPHTLYAASLAGEVLSLNPQTGEISWTATLPKPVFSSPCFTAKTVVIGCVDGILYGFSHTGEKMWTFLTHAPIFSSPCVHTDGSHDVVTILVGSHDSNIYCLQDNGMLLWKQKTDGFVYSSPSVTATSADTSLVREPNQKHPGSEYGNESHMNLNSGKQERMLGPGRDTGDHCDDCDGNSEDLKTMCPACRPARILVRVHDCFVAWCSSTGTVQLNKVADGYPVTSLTLPGEVFSSPVIVNDKIVVGCRNDYVYCLRIQKRREKIT